MRCFFGLHKWEYSNTFSALQEKAGLPIVGANRRDCLRCGIVRVYNAYIAARWRKQDGLGCNG